MVAAVVAACARSAVSSGGNAPPTSNRTDPPAVQREALAVMEGSEPPPIATFGRSGFEAEAMVGLDGRARMETLKISGDVTPEQRKAIEEWIRSAKFRLPLQDGKPVAARTRFMLTRGGGQAVAGAVPGASVMVPRPGDIRTEELERMAARVRGLRVDVDTLRLRPGQSLPLRDLVRVIALDSAMRPLGTLPFFDSESDARVVQMTGSSIRANTEGRSTIVIRWPRAVWQGTEATRPSVLLPVQVGADVRQTRVRTAGDGPMQITGTGSSDCFSSRDTDCEYVYRTLGQGLDRQAWFTSIIIVRREPIQLPSEMFDPRKMQEMEKLQREAMRAMEDRGRRPVGSWPLTMMGGSLVERSMYGDSLYLNERAYPLQSNMDSASVFLIDLRAGSRDTLRIVKVPADMPEGLLSKSWTSGDTTFSIRVRNREQILRTFLQRFPAIADFMR